MYRQLAQVQLTRLVTFDGKKKSNMETHVDFADEFPTVDAIKIKNGQWDAGKKVVPR